MEEKVKILLFPSEKPVEWALCADNTNFSYYTKLLESVSLFPKCALLFHLSILCQFHTTLPTTALYTFWYFVCKSSSVFLSVIDLAINF